MIAEHFDRFHGVLQIMENSLVAEIKSKKNCLNDLIKRLHIFADDLSDLIDAADYFTEPEKQQEVILFIIITSIIIVVLNVITYIAACMLVRFAVMTTTNVCVFRQENMKKVNN